MPSCSSKLSIQRRNEFNNVLNGCNCYKKIPFRLSSGVIFQYLLYVIDAIYVQVPWCCGKINCTLNHHFKTQVVPNNVVNFKKITYKVFVLLIFIFNHRVQRLDLIKKHCLITYLKFKQNVIWILFYFVLTRFLSNFILFYEFEPIIKQFNCSYGKFVNMEVETEVKNLPNGDKSPPNNNLHSAVINDCQITVKSEYPQINMHGNSIEVNIKEEVSDKSNIEVVVNGDITHCKDSELKKSVDLNELSQNGKDLSNGNIKNKPNGSNDDVVANAAKCEEKKSCDTVFNQVKCEDSPKPNGKFGESEKFKSKEKDQCVNNSSHHSSSTSSSSLSSKKYDSQSRSHQSSSSSSRHKYKDSRDDRHKSSSSKSNDVSSSSRRDEDKSKSESRSKSRSCHHKPDEKCHCKSHHHSHHHYSKKSKKVQSVKTQCSADEIIFELSQNRLEAENPFTRVPWVPHPQLANLKYGKFYRIEVDRNGGASVCHLYYDEISHLPEAQMKECAIEFIKLSYSEDENECAHHVMGIVHGAAAYLPDLVDYMADHYPTLIVKTGSLASRDNHTTTMSQYRDEVYKTYSNGTFRYAPLDQLSICGVLGEEVGAYFPDFVARLEQSPFMKPVMPWSFLSVVETDNPRESNDGPIFWVRPGEQMLPANEALKESARPKKRRNNELDNLYYIGASRSSEARESLFQDRTKAHADQVGVDYGLSNTAPTAAVGVLKAVNCGHPEHGNRATKDVVAFHAQDYNELLEILMLDLYEPPQTQCTKWIEVSKLNTLRREGIRYAHLKLHDNDVYYLPRKIIHQFQTISSVASVAWHIRYRDYFLVHGAPNLHTPTGINKGQVFYEKKNVAIYCPPVCENDILASVTNSESGLKTPKKVDRLKEYSPFKHSPRKMHKHQSPRSASKKQSDSVPSQSNGTVKSEHGLQTVDQDKKSNFSINSEPSTPNIDQDKKSNNGNSTSKKRERSKSNDERISSGDRVVKKEFEEESRKSEKSEKSENSHSRRSSGDYTPSKKDKKDSHSSHRKEVRNLESDFNLKKDKSSREKSKHDRRSDESKHSGSSKKKERREESSKSKSSSSSKHEKSRDHENSLKSKTEDKRNKEETGLKRKHEDSLNHSPAKKIKEENSDPSGEKSPKQGTETPSDSQSSEKSDTNVVIKEEVTEFKESEAELGQKQEPTNENQSRNSDENGLPEETTTFIPESCTNDLDLKQTYTNFVNQIPPFPPPLPPPPPPPSTSPPIDPPLPASPPENPLPPSSPPNYPPPSSPPRSQPPPPSEYSPNPKNYQSNSLQDSNAIKEKSDNNIKKVKKKAIKKENESYDLLGDIMSKMDKKK